ncbi:hypothetical protein IDH44_17845 [Paenibacillus sp. IB182496]|uniref:CRISPR type III-associated protein domain-containing protein n=1 Tax=Paenibacillus sabuli TaxID=2772509 RepID=A0A927GSS4_9BACL|nr:RAMP superfamily CRISPR-associated protein [Paenibacillus sabuli]MBD2847064.1 hypothetical protein [Paenibacillus sabuli]
MRHYRIIEIVNHEPLKIGAGGSKANQNEPSKDHLPGSTVRGALIAQLIRHGRFPEEKQAALLQRLYCYPAYPSAGDVLYLPAPQHLRMDKHRWRAYMHRLREHGDYESIEPFTISNLFEGDKGKDKNVLEPRFIGRDQVNGEPTLHGMKPKKVYRLHHNTKKNEDQREKENLFQYQALAPGQHFRALIAADEDVLDWIEPVLQAEPDWYIGGSRGSGYGRCSVRLTERPFGYEEAKGLLGLPSSEEVVNGNLTLTCLSDCIFRDGHGQPAPHYPVERLEEMLGVEVSVEKIYVQTGMTEGYNAKWQARYPKEACVKAGSVMRYKLKGTPDESLLQAGIRRLEAQLHGYRTQEGFGWIGVNLDYPNRLVMGAAGPKEAAGHATSQDGHLQVKENDEDWEVIRIMNAGLSEHVKTNWLEMICATSLEGNQSKPAIRPPTENGPALILADTLSNHHLGRMLREVEEWLGQRDQKETKPSQRKASGESQPDYMTDNAKCSIAGANFLRILDYLYRDPDQVMEADARITEYAQKMLGGVKAELLYADETNERMRQKRFIAELLRQGLWMMRRKHKDRETRKGGEGA